MAKIILSPVNLCTVTVFLNVRYIMYVVVSEIFKGPVSGFASQRPLLAEGGIVM